MVVVSMLCPCLQSSRFNRTYYHVGHLPLVPKLLKPCGLRSLTYFILTGEAGQACST